MRLKNIKGASEKILLGKYFINNPNEYKAKWHELFKNNNPIYIEIGMGKGNFIIKNALDNPNINYIGIEMYDSVILRAVEKTNELELNNLYLIRMDARLIEEVFDKEMLANCFQIDGEIIIDKNSEKPLCVSYELLRKKGSEHDEE